MKMNDYDKRVNLLNDYVIQKVEDIEPIICYRGNVFLDIKELHQWKITNLWNGIDIAVTEEDILR